MNVVWLAMRGGLVLTRIVHRVSDSADVPRFAPGANLLLYSATSDSRRATLDGCGGALF